MVQRLMTHVVIVTDYICQSETMRNNQTNISVFFTEKERGVKVLSA